MQKQHLKQQQKLILGPRQIQFLNLLQTPLVDLGKCIEEELEENPALEEELTKDNLEEDISYKNTNFKAVEIKPKELSDVSTSLTDFLINQLVGLNLDKNMFFLTKYIINSLDDNGFLNRDLYSVSSDLLTNFNLSVDESDLKNALSLVQQLDPIGVGANGLKHCLLIQLKNKPSNKITAYSIQILEDFYTPFTNKNFEFFFKKLNISSGDLKLVYKEIESLNPLPGRGFSKEPTNTEEAIIPDFIISNINDVLTLQVNSSGEKKVKIASAYEKLLANTKDEETKVFLTKKLDAAKWFQTAIVEREMTLKKVMTAILNKQISYFKSGDEKNLIPMKLADIAKNVSMDISTISRVSNSKYVETFFGTFLVKELFSEAYRKDSGEIISTKEVKAQLKKIIQEENKLAPFSDAKLTEMLEKNDYHIARRTVTKYRESLKIPTAKLRREL